MHTTMFYSPEQDAIGWSGDGGAITICIPMSSLRGLYRKVLRSIGEEPSIEGFFDFVKKAVSAVGNTVAKLAKSPIVKAVAGVIPYGATALTVVEMADSALSKAKSSVAKKPATHAIVRAAAKRDPKARAVLKKLPAAAKKKVARAAILQREAFRLKADLDMAVRALRAAGYTPGLQRAIRMQRAPWAR